MDNLLGDLKPEGWLITVLAPAHYAYPRSATASYSNDAWHAADKY